MRNTGIICIIVASELLQALLVPWQLRAQTVLLDRSRKRPIAAVTQEGARPDVRSLAGRAWHADVGWAITRFESTASSSDPFSFF